MTYQTPELLLVGAAQNLVLGGPLDKSATVSNYDSLDRGYVEFDIPDSEAW